jgi:hypothetical protein
MPKEPGFANPLAEGLGRHIAFATFLECWSNGVLEYWS